MKTATLHMSNQLLDIFARACETLNCEFEDVLTHFSFPKDTKIVSVKRKPFHEHFEFTDCEVEITSYTLPEKKNLCPSFEMQDGAMVMTSWGAID